MNTQSDADVLALWQQQAREEQIVPLENIRTKAERLDAKTRRWRTGTTLLVIGLLIKLAVEVWLEEAVLERAGNVLLIAAFVYIGYRYRKQRLAAPPVALGRTNCVEFYHAELVRQRDLSKDSSGYLLPFVPGMALAAFGGLLEDRPASQRIVLVVLGVGVFLSAHGWNMYTARKFQREIDALDAS